MMVVGLGGSCGDCLRNLFIRTLKEMKKHLYLGMMCVDIYLQSNVSTRSGFPFLYKGVFQYLCGVPSDKITLSHKAIPDFDLRFFFACS